jgi:hypothetical protein
VVVPPRADCWSTSSTPSSSTNGAPTAITPWASAPRTTLQSIAVCPPLPAAWNTATPASYSASLATAPGAWPSHSVVWPKCMDWELMNASSLTASQGVLLWRGSWISTPRMSRATPLRRIWSQGSSGTADRRSRWSLVLSPMAMEAEAVPWALYSQAKNSLRSGAGTQVTEFRSSQFFIRL